MLEVAAVTSGRNLPSSRYRIRQHVGPLLREGVRVRESCPAISKWAPVPGKPAGLSNRAILPVYAVWQALKLATRMPALLGSHARDLTWLNRELLPGYPTLEPLLKVPLVVDVDDAIWLTPPFGARAAQRLAARAEAMIVGNAHLAEWFAQHAGRIHVVPTAVDASAFRPPARAGAPSGPFVVGWMGTRGNLAYLEAIEEGLLPFFRRHAGARLLVVSDGKPRFRHLAPEQVVCRAWSPAIEIPALQRMDVGLMPLRDTPWTRGKCAFKMLQYMAVEVPVVVSPVGMNAEVLALAEVGFAADTLPSWDEALQALLTDRDAARRMGRSGRRVVLAHFDRGPVAHRIAEVFKSL